MILDVAACQQGQAMLSTSPAAPSSGILNDAPWQRLADSLAGLRAADSATVGMIERRTAEFFHSEERISARQLVSSLRTHYQSVRSLIATTADTTLRRR